MRKVVASPYMSLDGLIALPDGASGWPATGSGAYYAREILPLLFAQADTIVLGRKTYETLVQYWPSASEQDPFATAMNTLPKIVFSQSLVQVAWGTWQNATLVHDDPAAIIAQLKQQAGKNLLIFGSGKLTSALAQADLIDDYWLQVHPVMLGSGVSLFSGLSRRLDLALLEASSSEDGVLILHYQPRGEVI